MANKTHINEGRVSYGHNLLGITKLHSQLDGTICILARIAINYVDWYYNGKSCYERNGSRVYPVC